MAYKEKDTKKWTAQWFETTAKGEKKKRRKRGVDTKRDALDYERQKKSNSKKSMDMKLSEFMEVYFEDKQNDLKERTIKNNSITKTYYRTDEQDVITEPKTKQSVRVIEIPQFLTQEIKDFMEGHYQRLELLVEQMKAGAGVTEKLKATNQMKYKPYKCKI